MALGIGVILVAVLIRAASINRLIRRKLRISFLLAAVYVLGTAVLHYTGLSAANAVRIQSVIELCFALAVINIVVITAINPLREDRVPERFPNILQDTIIIGLFFVVATLVMQEKFLTTSAVGAVVIGFALQDTLGNTFAGLAIQVEKPFRVGHWIRVASHEGQVSEVTWRATRLRTKTGNMVILPNSMLSKEAIVNYSQPAVPTRLEVEVGVSYSVSPDRVKSALLEAAGNVSMALREPSPDAVLVSFGPSAIVYRVRFWVEDFGRDAAARDQMQSAIYYALRRHGYEIPFPIQVEIPRQEAPESASSRTRRIDSILAPLELFAPLTEEQRHALAAGALERIYGKGERIVRQGDAGGSMFVIRCGRVRVVENAAGELAVVEAGGYIGEMSLLTGQPRSATVEALEECELVELTSEALRDIALANPDVVQRIGSVVSARQAAIERHRAVAVAGQPASTEAQRPLLARIQEFLRLPRLIGE